MEELRFNTPSSKGNGKAYNKTRSEANHRVNKMLKVDAFKARMREAEQELMFTNPDAYVNGLLSQMG